jgi:uncharacterized protein YeaO (DUF488 family)
MSPIALKSAYAKAEQSDGRRILVDRLWPRGVSKEHLDIDAWAKDLAPSNALRQWFRHDPARWEEFRRRYFEELGAHEGLVDEFIDQIGNGPVTLVFAASDHQHNNAVALRDYLERKLTN